MTHPCHINAYTVGFTTIASIRLHSLDQLHFLSTLPPIPFQMARRSIDFLCTLAQPRNLIDFPLYIYAFEDRGCREIRFRACGIDQKKNPWKLDRFPSLYLLLLSSEFSSSGSFSRHQLKNHLLLSSSEMSSPKEGSAPTVSKLHWYAIFFLFQICFFFILYKTFNT